MDAYFRAANGEKKKFHRKIQKDGGKEWNEKKQSLFQVPLHIHNIKEKFFTWPPCGGYTNLSVKTIFISHYPHLTTFPRGNHGVAETTCSNKGTSVLHLG